MFYCKVIFDFFEKYLPLGHWWPGKYLHSAKCPKTDQKTLYFDTFHAVTEWANTCSKSANMKKEQYQWSLYCGFTTCISNGACLPLKVPLFTMYLRPKLNAQNTFIRHSRRLLWIQFRSCVQWVVVKKLSTYVVIASFCQCCVRCSIQGQLYFNL